LLCEGGRLSLGRNILSAILNASLPLILIMPIADSPKDVAIAAIVSSLSNFILKA